MTFILRQLAPSIEPPRGFSFHLEEFDKCSRYRTIRRAFVLDLETSKHAVAAYSRSASFRSRLFCILKIWQPNTQIKNQATPLILGAVNVNASWLTRSKRSSEINRRAYAAIRVELNTVIRPMLRKVPAGVRHQDPRKPGRIAIRHFLKMG